MLPRPLETDSECGLALQAGHSHQPAIRRVLQGPGGDSGVWSLGSRAWGPGDQSAGSSAAAAEAGPGKSLR